jgi:hypothetical protein
MRASCLTSTPPTCISKIFEADGLEDVFHKMQGNYFVRLMNGPDNDSPYVYIGIIQNCAFRWTQKSKVGPKDASQL